MSVLWDNMKLKLRVAILVCAFLSFLALFLTVNQLPSLHDRTALHRMAPRLKLKFQESAEIPHIYTVRKRLSKSNYTSENRSPEVVKTYPGSENETVEDVKETNELTDSQLRRYWLKQRKPRLLNRTVAIQDVLERKNDDVEYMLSKLQNSDGLKFNFQKITLLSYKDFLKLQRHRGRRRGPGLPIYENYNGGPDFANWEKFHKGIHQFGLYSDSDVAVEGVMEDMSNQQIIDIEMKEGGTQLKLIITFTDEGQALFKPMRLSREQETLPDHFYFVDFERHNAEIAAFHLDRILGFNRVPPTIGREVNLTSEIKRLAEPKLRKTFFISPANNVCFHGVCSYYCDTGHAVCGHPVMLEGSFAAFLPPERVAPRKTWRNPWKRSYSKHRKAYWENYDDLCERVREKEPYRSGRRLLDIIDMHVFDFLTGNMDRHHYETFTDFGNETFLLHLDNGRGFGQSGHDETSILAPLFQCCTIRYSTFVKLVKLYLGPEHLSELMGLSLKHDPVNPVLNDRHISALDRRVIKILTTVYDCLQSSPYTDVILDDFF